LYSVDGAEEQASTYSSLLQQAEDITFNCSSADRSMLEDAERMLVLCIEVSKICVRCRVCHFYQCDLWVGTLSLQPFLASNLGCERQHM
jgi:hypothetical protein